MRPDEQAALALIEERGTPLERARIRVVLCGTQAESGPVRELLGLQNPDGGFPYGFTSGRASSLSVTSQVLSWLSDLDLLKTAAAARAGDYISRSQLSDGAWDENPEVAAYSPPPWAVPGNPVTRAWLTAAAAFWLARLSSPAHPGVQRALPSLRRMQHAGGRLDGPPHATWLAAGLFLMLGPEGEQDAQRCTAALLSRPPERWVDSQLAWALDVLALAGAGEGHPLVRGLLPELCRRWRDHRIISSEDGPDSDLNATITALKVLRRFQGRLPRRDS